LRSLGYRGEVQVAVGLGLALVCALAWRVFGGYEREGRGRAGSATPGLAPREAALLAAAAEALYPAGGALPAGVDAGVPAWCARWLAVLPPGTRRLVRALFALVEHGTLLFPARGWDGLRRFSALDAERRRAVLEGWRTSRFFARRLVFTSLRAIVTQAYFADPAVLRALRLAPYEITPPVTAADALYPPIGRTRAEIRYRPDQVDVPGPLARPPAGVPLTPGDALHPGYRGPA
jgi:hypothetical protein